jgi:hypothetical protein
MESQLSAQKENSEAKKLKEAEKTKLELLLKSNQLELVAFEKEGLGDFSRIKNGESISSTWAACNLCHEIFSISNFNYNSLTRHKITDSHVFRVPDSEQHSIAEVFKKMKVKELSETDANKLALSFTDLCCSHFLPFWLVNQKKFHDFANMLLSMGSKGFTNVKKLLPSDDSLSNKFLTSLYNSRKNAVQLKIGDNKNFGVTLDIWKTKYRRLSYLGLTCHFVNKNYEMECVYPGLVYLKGKKTSDKIKTAYEYALSVLMPHDSIFTFTSDNGKNIIKSLDSENALTCMNHNISLVVKSFLSHLKPKKKSNENEDDANEEVALNDNEIDELNENVNDEHIIENDRNDTIYSSSSSFESSESEIELLDHQLDESECEEILKKYRPTYNLGKKLVRLYKIGPDNYTLKKSLKDTCITRWNTDYIMLHSIAENYDELLKALSRLNKYAIAAALKKEIKNIKEICHFLEVFYDFTVNLSSATRPTMQLVVPYLYSLKDHCIINPLDSELTKAMKFLANKYLSSKYEAKITELHNLAVFLDPCRKEMSFYNLSKRCSIRLLMLKKIENMEIANLQKNVFIPQPSDEIRTSLKLLNKYTNVKEIMGPEEEIEKYLNSHVVEDDILSYWKLNQENYPRLSKYAREIFCAQATETPAERIFSISGITYSDRSSNLAIRTLVRKSFIKLNS